MGSESELLPNWTTLIQLGIFFACYFVLNKFVFGPYLKLLDARKAKTTGLKAQALKDKERAETLRAEYETSMKSERKRLQAWMDDERKTLGEEERQTIQKARTTLGEELSVMKANLKSEMDKTRKELVPLTAEYSSHIASKLIGRKVSVTAAGAEKSKRSSAEPTVPG